MGIRVHAFYYSQKQYTTWQGIELSFFKAPCLDKDVDLTSVNQCVQV